MGGLKPNETILIHSVGGGVGIAATQIARHIGARVIGTASAAQHGELRALGVDHLIDYRTKDFEARAREITGGRGVELIRPERFPTSGAARARSRTRVFFWPRTRGANSRQRRSSSQPAARSDAPTASAPNRPAPAWRRGEAQRQCATLHETRPWLFPVLHGLRDAIWRRAIFLDMQPLDCRLS
jgi:hypothetical protein